MKATKQQDVTSIGAESAKTTEQARKAAHDLVDTAAEKAEVVEKQLREEASRLGEAAGQKREDLSQKIDDGLKRADDFIQTRPMAAAGIAFAAGALAALILKRS